MPSFVSYVIQQRHIQNSISNITIKLFCSKVNFFAGVYFLWSCRFDPAGMYLFKVNDASIRTMCKICFKLKIKTPERCHWCRSGVFIVTLNSFHKFFWGFRSSLWLSKFWLGQSRTWLSRTLAGIFPQGRVIVIQPLNIFAKRLHRRYSTRFWIRLWFKVNLHCKIKCIRLFCICNFHRNFFYFASLFIIGFLPAFVPYKPSVLLFLPHEQHGGLQKNPENVNKIPADPGNDMTTADSCKLLNKGSILVASFLNFRVSQISNTNSKYKVIIFHSVILIPDSTQVQGCGIVCMLIIL